MACRLYVNDKLLIRFDIPLNPAFIFQTRRKYGVSVVSNGGKEIRIKRTKPLSAQELQNLYLDIEYRQQAVSSPIPESVFEISSSLIDCAVHAWELSGFLTVERMWYHSGHKSGHEFASRVDAGFLDKDTRALCSQQNFLSIARSFELFGQAVAAEVDSRPPRRPDAMASGTRSWVSTA